MRMHKDDTRPATSVYVDGEVCASRSCGLEVNVRTSSSTSPHCSPLIVYSLASQHFQTGPCLLGGVGWPCKNTAVLRMVEWNHATVLHGTAYPFAAWAGHRADGSPCSMLTPSLHPSVCCWNITLESASLGCDR